MVNIVFFVAIFRRLFNNILQHFTTFLTWNPFLWQYFTDCLTIFYNISQCFSPGPWPGSAGCEASNSEAGSCSGESWSAGDSDSESELESVSESLSRSKLAAPLANWPGQPELPAAAPGPLATAPAGEPRLTIIYPGPGPLRLCCPLWK